jgi:hypothetical protein
MYFMYPIAYPTALLLDYFLGESHGTVYKKAGTGQSYIDLFISHLKVLNLRLLGLKTLVSLHKAADENGDVDGLTEDEVTIIGAVLDLRAKPVFKIMTPIADCFVLSTDAILDEKVMDQVKSYLGFLIYVAMTYPGFFVSDCFSWLFTYSCAFTRQ